MASAPKLPCRLCYYDTTDTVDLFGEAGIEKDFVRKIRKYLYLLVQGTDGRQSICWMCSQQLEAFHQFFTKINEIQKSVHKEHYEEMVLPDPVKNDKHTFEPHNPSPVGEIDNDDKLLDASDGSVKKHEVVGREISKKNPGLSSSSITETQTHDPDDAAGLNIGKRIKREYAIDIGDKEGPPQSPSEKDGHVVSIEIEPHQPPVLESKNKEQQAISLDIVQVKQESYSVKPPVKRGPGRPRGTKSKSKVSPSPKIKRPKLHAHQDLPYQRLGDSDEEPPSVTQETGVEEWTPDMDTFPTKIIKDGLLLYKGRKMMAMVCRYYNLKCDQCDTKHKFNDLHDLFAHYTDIHKTRGYVTCCSSKLVTYASIILHMAKHLQPDAFQCEICGYMVTRPRFLENHRKTHLPDDQKPFACFICHRAFCWKTALLTHMISHQPPEERKKYICHICGKTYDTPGSLSAHKKIQHTERPKESHVCDICAKKFSSRAGLSEHMSSIHQPREINQIQCPVCSKWCMNKRCLKTHMLLHSDVELECHLCEYKTRKKTLLERHHVNKHSDLRPFACDQCNKTFKFKRALTVHLSQSHATEKVMHQCNFCERQFRSSTNFYSHRKTMHPEELESMRRDAEKEQRMLRVEAGIEDMSPDEDEIEIEIITFKDDDDDGEEVKYEEDEEVQLMEVID